jgi:hypothetical protein
MLILIQQDFPENLVGRLTPKPKPDWEELVGNPQAKTTAASYIAVEEVNAQ